MKTRPVERENFVIGHTYFDVPDDPANGYADSFVYVGVFNHDKYGASHFMYPLNPCVYPEIEADGTVAFGLTGTDFYEEV